MVNIPTYKTYLDKATGRIKVPNVGKLIYNTYYLPTNSNIVLPPDVRVQLIKRLRL